MRVSGRGNGDLPWLYIQPLQNIGGGGGGGGGGWGVLKCVSCWVNEFARHLFMDIL